MTYFTKSQKFENEGTHHGLFLVIFGQNLITSSFIIEKYIHGNICNTTLILIFSNVLNNKDHASLCRKYILFLIRKPSLF